MPATPRIRPSRRQTVGFLLASLMAIAGGLAYRPLRTYLISQPQENSFWEESLSDQARSPDGRYVAAVFAGDGGTLGGSGWHVHLVHRQYRFQSHYSLSDAPGRVAASRDPMRISWQGPGKLLIVGHSGGNSHKERRWEDVEILYR